MRESKGGKGSEAYVILGFRVPTTSVGARGEVVRASKGAKVVRRSKGGEWTGQVCYAMF